jgi:PQQ-dependent catabolism-associated CXXCW motif protein
VRSCLAVLLLFASSITQGEEVPEPAGYWTGPIESAVPASIAGGKVIHAQELARLIEREKPVLIDSSNAPAQPPQLAPGARWLPLPHPAIPGALWIPGIGLGDIPPEVDRFFRERLAQATGGNPAHPVVVYCHERCWLSWNAAKRAISYGYARVYWLPEGIEGWRTAGYETKTVDAEGPGNAQKPILQSAEE